MGYQEKGIPYAIFFGLNINFSKHKLDNKTVSKYITGLKGINFDYVITNVSSESQDDRRSRVKTSPTFINELLFSTRKWNYHHVTKLHLSDLKDYGNMDLILQDIEFSNHLNSQFVVIDYQREFNINNFFFANKFIKTITSEYKKNNFYLVLDMDRESLHLWYKLFSMCDYPQNLGIILKMGKEIPEESILDEWLSNNVKGMQFPVTSFIKNVNDKYNFLTE